MRHAGHLGLTRMPLDLARKGREYLSRGEDISVSAQRRSCLDHGQYRTPTFASPSVRAQKLIWATHMALNST